MILSIITCTFLATLANADILWPLYNQQCRDDAGPPFLDDVPGKFYHDGSQAQPILSPNGDCAGPLESACKSRPTKKVAYMEGPIDCGDKGWYCRIMPDTNWDPVNLIPDLNFGHCNTSAAFKDAGYDQDGHCHGSSDESTYYWWMRDHYHRGYNGRLRCCCGWYEGGDTPLYSGRIANRCDYRRLVTKDENLDDCRDANEDHGLGYDDIGCNSAYESQIGSVIPESDDTCWELSKFGFSEGDENDDERDENDDEEEENDDYDDDYEECYEEKSTEFVAKYKKKRDKYILKTCGWLKKQKKNRVKKLCRKKKSKSDEYGVARDECPVTCDMC